MTVSTKSTSPLVVVVGATGIQGGSVIRHLIESDKMYRLRGLTRDASKPAALKLRELGVEVTSVTIAVGNDAAVREAFKGADIVFGVTNFWEHVDPARETAEGKLIVDAAKAAGAKLFIWSGLEDIAKGTSGKYKHVYHFDSKAAVTAYAHSQLPTVDVQAGFYMSNWDNPLIAPRRLEGGSLIWDHPSASSATHIPYIDTANDYGLFVRYAIETPEFRAGGKAIYTYGELLTHPQAAEAFKRVRGVELPIQPVPLETYLERVQALGVPEVVVDDVRDIEFMTEFGYYVGKESSTEQQKIRSGLARQPQTFEDFLRANPDYLKA
ncbi:NAD(P)-binding protein [Auricularia subglabra TFB-10046 SS5]|nr:NAD(P)-binding protein [Auricularia subglabra TFB-10046 SS5]